MKSNRHWRQNTKGVVQRNQSKTQYEMYDANMTMVSELFLVARGAQLTWQGVEPWFDRGRDPASSDGTRIKEEKQEHPD